MRICVVTTPRPNSRHHLYRTKANQSVLPLFPYLPSMYFTEVCYSKPHLVFNFVQIRDSNHFPPVFTTSMLPVTPIQFFALSSLLVTRPARLSHLILLNATYSPCAEPLTITKRGISFRNFVVWPGLEPRTSPGHGVLSPSELSDRYSGLFMNYWLSSKHLSVT